jgi:hypothetical protein
MIESAKQAQDPEFKSQNCPKIKIKKQRKKYLRKFFRPRANNNYNTHKKN